MPISVKFAMPFPTTLQTCLRLSRPEGGGPVASGCPVIVTTCLNDAIYTISREMERVWYAA